MLKLIVIDIIFSVLNEPHFLIVFLKILHYSKTPATAIYTMRCILMEIEAVRLINIARRLALSRSQMTNGGASFDSVNAGFSKTLLSTNKSVISYFSIYPNKENPIVTVRELTYSHIDRSDSESPNRIHTHAHGPGKREVFHRSFFVSSALTTKLNKKKSNVHL